MSFVLGFYVVAGLVVSLLWVGVCLLVLVCLFYCGYFVVVCDCRL